jgi:hypothetical protein
VNEVSEETRKKWKDKLQTIEEALNCGCIELSKWEEEFLNSIHERVLADNDISFKQSSCLSRIYEKVC